MTNVKIQNKKHQLPKVPGLGFGAFPLWIFLAVFILTFSGCSDFYHLHYRKVKKVPAKGFVEARNEKDFNEPVSSLPGADSSKVSEAEIILVNEDSASPVKTTKHGYDLLPAIKKRAVNVPLIKKVFREKKQLQRPPLPEYPNDRSGLIVFGLLLLGFGMLITGISLVVTAIYGAIWLMLLLGIALTLLGFFPFLVLLSYISPKQHNPYKE